MNPETWERLREYYLDPVRALGRISINPDALVPWLAAIAAFYWVARKNPPRRVLISFLIVPLFAVLVLIEPELIVWQFLIVPAWIIYVYREMTAQDRQRRKYQQQIVRQWPKRQRRIAAAKAAATPRDRPRI